MRKTILVLLLVSLCSISYAAGVKQRIVLLDNSVIVGEIVEMKDGIYTVKSDVMGEIMVPADKILEISKLDQARSATSQNIDILDRSKKSAHKTPAKPRTIGGSDDLTIQQERANSQVQSMTMQEDFLENMMDLSGSANMLDVMSDPEVMDAISRNDYEFLMNNDKMKGLMESSEIKDLLGE